MAVSCNLGPARCYVWPCYALALIVVGLNIVWARRSLRLAQREARRRLSMAQVPRPPGVREAARAAGSSP